ncbi:hypothetical protein ACQR0Z_17430 [Bradyrhizobium sp. HKCCYLS3077]|uniref:hypothetical protein n=1 Tax=Bradyrhizobium sp. HKCCYLS3077 TaxID=3420761 RepID=UPI003EB77108
MKAIQLKATGAELASLAVGTAANYFRELQAGKLVEKGSSGRYGGVVISNSGRVNTLLGFVFDPPFGESRVSLVKQIRGLELSSAVFGPLRHDLNFYDSARSAFQFVQGLGIDFSADLGTALDGLVGGFRTGAFEEWEAGARVDITVEFNGQRSAMVMIDRPGTNNAAAFTYEPKKAQPPAAVERITRLHRVVFESLAADDETAPDQG